MPYRRGGFALTPPSLVIFLISLVLALIALLIRYAHVSVPIISSARVFDVLAIAYVVLVIGVLFRRMCDATSAFSKPPRDPRVHFGDSIGTFDHGQFFHEPSFADTCRSTTWPAPPLQRFRPMPPFCRKSRPQRRCAIQISPQRKIRRRPSRKDVAEPLANSDRVIDRLRR